MKQIVSIQPTEYILSDKSVLYRIDRCCRLSVVNESKTNAYIVL